MNLAVELLEVAALVAVIVVAAILSVRLGRDELDRRARGAVEPELVRVHYREEGEPSVEGILLAVGSTHYRLGNARQFVSEDHSVALDGEAWIPRERVVLVQRL